MFYPYFHFAKGFGDAHIDDRLISTRRITCPPNALKLPVWYLHLDDNRCDFRQARDSLSLANIRTGWSRGFRQIIYGLSWKLGFSRTIKDSWQKLGLLMDWAQKSGTRGRWGTRLLQKPRLSTDEEGVIAKRRDFRQNKEGVIARNLRGKRISFSKARTFYEKNLLLLAEKYLLKWCTWKFRERGCCE